jgi:hypothetical protein
MRRLRREKFFTSITRPPDTSSRRVLDLGPREFLRIPDGRTRLFLGGVKRTLPSFMDTAIL